MTAAAYILFYQRRGVDMNALDYSKIQNTFDSALQGETLLPQTGGTLDD